MSNMEYLKNKPIAILGAGACGKAQAGDCALGGAITRICDLPPFAEKTLFGIKEQGLKFFGEQLNLYGFERSGVAQFDKVTTNVADAVKGAGIVIVTTPSIGHMPFFEQLVPALEDGMVIHIFPDNYGSLLLRKMMREAGCTKKVIIGGWSSAPYGSRVEIKGGVVLPKVRAYYRAITLRGAALPTTDQDDFLESTKYIPSMDAITKGDGVVGGETVMDTGFSNVNPVLHCPGTILGVGVMENWGVIYGENKYDFSIYSHAYCPSISQVQYTLYQEQCKLAAAMGVGIQAFDKKQFFSRENILGPEYMGPDYEIPFDQQDYIQFGTGPHTINNRYITEDIPVGCHVYHELGKKFGVKTPVVDSMINLANAMLETDFYESGYSLEYLGIGHMDKDEMLQYLHEGVYKEEV
ncbi:NAD/NADP octopine/nopaline dehydrogenase family protein [Desulfosporosinus sp. BICA1-9]|uniref:NAD/NADP octopine/nopaline dehydrogenase family protein n=1 Tax=Desulfosporosinus sp. BICA1-9 TaxID=1531958 RepID=UPI00054B63FF|nr:NAD/NADP octopine/nopaline dehydrogenase family protein [Desulfosporosinus sp. BICA1-9]KJS85859.1 MAG: NAD/NADP octopine/nopaline dehydrogenase [Desulfosporosinus sp. BICA1-9]HBW39182.1 NAD/NADP octopine/nopaline dehydrogenase [Desulfosporosinus sp.]